MSEPERPHEIVIIRRSHDDDHDAHHGGVWKIAFADFMTAMMAFFLVLWIVNSSSKETRSSIALYFNPVQLTNSTAARKGLQDPKKLDSDASHTSNVREPEAKQNEDKEGGAVTVEDHKPQRQGPASETEKPRGEVKDPKSAPDVKEQAAARPGGGAASAAQSALKPGAINESALFRDPYAVLSEIAASSEEGGLKKETRERPPEANTGRLGLNAADKFRDPFEPVVPVLRSQALDTSSANQIANTLDTSAQPPRSIAGVGSVPVNAGSPPQDRAQDRPQDKPQDRSLDKAASGASDEATGVSGDQAAKLKVLLDQALRDEVGVKKSPRIELKTTQEGTLISLTDDLEFGMFKIGSAEPDPKTIRVMAKIGNILKSVPGSVVVRGHTDSRSYRTASGDNWRLSSSRAQMAFYMLVRGGFDEKRFDRVEGHADRHLKNVASPFAAENRRIEILVRNDKS
ncbi:chemotaxis protein MotB [Beijerinckia sp. GAS462]|nr:chemotaxis protein MotB [Beijerinckia sp. GAS462]SED28167.1 chemotaxis protein MotB [Beijerinckia sp. 28-YEA-48]